MFILTFKATRAVNVMTFSLQKTYTDYLYRRRLQIWYHWKPADPYRCSYSLTCKSAFFAENSMLRDTLSNRLVRKRQINLCKSRWCMKLGKLPTWERNSNYSTSHDSSHPNLYFKWSLSSSWYIEIYVTLYLNQKVERFLFENRALKFWKSEE